MYSIPVVVDRARERWAALDRWAKRAVVAVVAVAAMVSILAVSYHAMITGIEGQSSSPAHSLQVVVETFTGTGFGSDSPWESTAANLFVAAMDLSTFLVLFVVFPYVFTPVLENALSPSPPTSADAEDHVLLCGASGLTERLVDELTSRGVHPVVLTESASTSVDLAEAGVEAVHGDPTDIDALERADADEARAVIVEATDERTASVVLAIDRIDPTLRTVAVVDHLDHEAQLRSAGADRVVTPRGLLGRRLGERARHELDPAGSDAVTLADGVSMLELTAGPGGTAAGRSVGDVAADGDVSVVGLWSDGRYLDDPPRDVVVAPGDVLLLVGRQEAIRSLEVGSRRAESARPTVLIAGNGLVGDHARRVLADAAVSVRTIDESERTDVESERTDVESERTDVDVVGDATDAETLRRAGLDEADVVIAALPDDDATVLTTLSAVEGEREPTVIARLDDDDNEPNLRRAGADYVLSVTTLGGRVLVSDALDESTVGVDRQLRTAWLDGDRFAGRPIRETPVAGSTCSLVGVEREGTFLTDLGLSSVVREDDRLVVVGPDDEVGAIR